MGPPTLESKNLMVCDLLCPIANRWDKRRSEDSYLSSSREVVGQLESDCFSSDGRSKSSGICSPRASYLRKLADVASNGELLDWPKNDTRRFFHVVYRVGDLDRTIKFYTECFGMKVSRQRDVPKEKYSNAFMGFGSEKSHFAVELTYSIYILSCLSVVL
ncbi:hypothetical protein F2Q70_00019762 [Brassica cretica]|uniref:VOC domain-containing protein n=1 Tax=Brassica cretica TaxID=69181 RepID=A0A8S9GSW4_BRACR|nr:hypothetical protein F2Q70_00019762 [Brassica cretica]